MAHAFGITINSLAREYYILIWLESPVDVRNGLKDQFSQGDSSSPSKLQEDIYGFHQVTIYIYVGIELFHSTKNIVR